MNFNIYNNNTIFNIGLAKLDIMNYAMHMACRAHFNDQHRLWSISSLVLSLLFDVLIIISSIDKNIRLMYRYRIGYIFKGVSVSAILFMVSIGIDIANTYLKYR